MSQFRLIASRGVGFPALTLHSSRISQHTSISLTLRKSLQRHLATKPPTPSSSPSSTPSAAKVAAQDAVKRQAQKVATSSAAKNDISDRVLIYHAGTGRTTFIAMFKVTTLFITAFFCGIIIPSYVNSGKDILDTAQVALCGIIPPIFTTLTTSPFVTHMYAQIPAHARASPAALERFLSKPQSTPIKLTITTMSLIAKPRHSTMAIGDLVHKKSRLGLVNYVRRNEAAKEEDARRKWYMYRAVRQFYVQPGRPGANIKGRYQEKKKDPVAWWIWDALKEQIDSQTKA